MDIERLNNVLNNKEKVNIFYNERPIWVQELNDANIARIGFVDNFEEKDVYISDLYERNL